jgi:competence protein ComEA
VAAFWFAVPFETTSIEPAASSVELAQMVRVDINHDDAAALATLPGVGEKKAQAIIDYRTRHGAFKTVQEVTRVSGITKKLVESWGNMAYAG